jgi:ATP adenylyltransferase
MTDSGPDEFDRLWTPHRMAYIRGENKPQDSDDAAQCPFCRAPAGSDADGLVIARGELVYAVLNLYPYNAGHLLVLPYRHVSDYTDLDAAECGSSPISPSTPCARSARCRRRTGSTSG